MVHYFSDKQSPEYDFCSTSQPGPVMILKTELGSFRVVLLLKPALYFTQSLHLEQNKSIEL